jgi:hypothetical protein
MGITAAELLDRLEREADGATREAEALAAGLTGAQLAWPPAEGAWSIAQCLDHLRVTNELYFAPLRSALTAAPPGAPEGDYRAGMLARWFIRAVGPQGTSRMKAPKRFRPDAAPAPADAAEAFAASQRTLASLIGRARGCDPQKVKIASPVARILRFTAAEALELMVAHEQRHLAQAARVRSHPAFPPG